MPIERGFRLERDDELRRTIIQMLMCDFELSVATVEAAYGIVSNDYFAPELEKLAVLTGAGRLTIEPQWLTVSPRGRLPIRNVCRAFDRYLNRAAETLRY